MAAIVKNRLQKQGIGFGAQVRSKGEEHKFLSQVKAEDLIAYGFESEFIGRLPVIAVLEPLEVEDLRQILENPNNPVILAKKEDFRSYGIDIRFEEEALRIVAERAYEEKTGARGLVSVLEKVLLPYEKRLPSSSIRYVVITEDVVLDPVGELARLMERSDDPERWNRYQAIIEEEKRGIREQVLKREKHYVENYPLVFSPERVELVIEHHVRTGLQVEGIFDEVILLYNQIKVFESDFYEKYRFQIHFDDEAVNALVAKALERDTTATALCLEVSRDFDYGFKLISDRTGQSRFVLPGKSVLHPEVYIDELIRENYRQYPPDLSKAKKE